MPRILLAALAGLAVLVVPAIAAGDSSKSPSSDVRVVQQAEPNAVLVRARADLPTMVTSRTRVRTTRAGTAPATTTRPTTS